MLDELAGQVRGVVSRMDAREPTDMDGNAIEPGQFLPIASGEPAKTAFVDGGNASISESPSFVASLNRVCFTVYRGEKRETPGCSAAEFFSLTTFSRRGGAVRSEARMFSEPGDARWMPDEDDMRVSQVSSDQRPRISSLPRKVAEWKLALWAAVNELGEGDVLVMDGPLQAGSEGREEKYARELYDMAESKKVVLCGLSKTSRAMTKSGQVLLPPIHRAGLEARGRTKWFVPVGSGGGGRWRSLAVRLHEEADYVFRLDILENQYEKEAGRVMSSLAANSTDPSIPGYPYGAIDADNVARVRGGHAAAARDALTAKMMSGPEWEAYDRNAKSIDMHGRLDRVV